jgi:hypothetical protein
MIRAFRRHIEHAHRVRQFRRLIADAPTASVRWDLITIAARSLDYPGGRAKPGETSQMGDRGARHRDIA